jgi:AraC-like DNA-binding protein
MNRPPLLLKEAYFKKDGFPIVVMRVAATPSRDLHAHEFHELVLITGGSGRHVTEQEDWPIAAGDVFVIKGEQAHAYAASDRLTLINILYDPVKLALPRRDMQALPGYHALFTLEPGRRGRRGFKSRLCLSLNELAHAESLVDAMADELKARAPGFQLMCRAQFLQLIGFLSRCYTHSVAPARRDLVRIAETMAFIENHYSKEIYIDKLAAIAHMSKRNFLRVFREATGKSPMAYLLSLRIARAAELLREGRSNITETGFQVGFQDGNYFARQFRALMGVSPRDYARRTATRVPFGK